MKLTPTTEKVSIQWFAVLRGGEKMRNVKGFQHNAWDAKCSCGWESRTGGAIKASVKRSVDEHKWFDHNYQWISSERNSNSRYSQLLELAKAGA